MNPEQLLIVRCSANGGEAVIRAQRWTLGLSMWSTYRHLIITSVLCAAHSLNPAFRAFKRHLWSLLELDVRNSEKRNTETPSLECRWFAGIQKWTRLGNKWADLAQELHIGSSEEARAFLKWQNIKIIVISGSCVSQRADRSLLIVVLSGVFNVEQDDSITFQDVQLIQDWMCFLTKKLNKQCDICWQPQNCVKSAKNNKSTKMYNFFFNHLKYIFSLKKKSYMMLITLTVDKLPVN